MRCTFFGSAKRLGTGSDWMTPVSVNSSTPLRGSTRFVKMFTLPLLQPTSAANQDPQRNNVDHGRRLYLTDRGSGPVVLPQLAPQPGLRQLPVPLDRFGRNLQ